MMNQFVPSRIYLLRHAKSAWAQVGERDFDRALDREGLAEAESVAEKAAALGYRPDRLITSTALRCRQTAEVIRNAFGREFDLILADQLYNAAADTYLDLLSLENTGSLMIVGHNPTIEEVLERLVGQEQCAGAIALGFPTAGLAVVDRPLAREQSLWRLVDFLSP
jgi:phosphohistidine phosphatase